MHDLDRSIIATLGYYEILGRPLTLMELTRRLIPSTRLGGREINPAVSDILERLDILSAIGTILHEDGLYALTGTAPSFAFYWIEQEKIWAQKWRRMLRKSFWLQAIPYVRALCASGSLALGTMSTNSDWDMFVIAVTDRLYTARIGLLLTAWTLGALRKKNDVQVADKFCFNHYVATSGLMNWHRSLYTAHTLTALVPILERENYCERFWQANHWIKDFCPEPKKTEYIHRTMQYSRTLNLFRCCLELILNTYIGDALEFILRIWQQRRIRLEPATHEKGGRIIADKREIEFHPRSFEVVALSGYNSILDHYGLGAYIEHDSGLS